MMANSKLSTKQKGRNTMAKQVVTEIVDDYTGGDADESTGFIFEGIYYGLDLSDDNAAKLRADLAPWMDAASERKKIGKTPRTMAAPKATNGHVTDAEVRAWASDEGMPVSGRGRISADLKDQFLKAHKGRKTR